MNLTAKTAALVIGIVFIAVGILGFIPESAGVADWNFRGQYGA